MQTNEFMKNLKNYYGDLPEIVELVLAEYISKTYYEEELERLFKLITDEYTNTFKTFPDKAKIKEIVQKYNDSWEGIDTKLGKYWKDLKVKKQLESEKWEKERKEIEDRYNKKQIENNVEENPFTDVH